MAELTLIKKDINGDTKTTIIDFKSAEDAQKYDVSMEQLSLYAIGYPRNYQVKRQISCRFTIWIRTTLILKKFKLMI